MLKFINSVDPFRTLEVDHDYIDTAKTGILGLVSLLKKKLMSNNGILFAVPNDRQHPGISLAHTITNIRNILVKTKKNQQQNVTSNGAAAIELTWHLLFILRI